MVSQNHEAEAWTFWVDRGGTFTDLIGVGPEGPAVVKKLLSHNPARYEDPISFGIHSVLSQGDTPRRAREIRIGTTMATNALLERKGEPCVLITTKGFRDVLKIGWQTRPDLFALKIELPDMLYDHVCEIDERILSDGGIESKPDESVVLEQLKICKDLGYQSCAVVFMHAWVNPSHEKLVGQLAKEAGFQWVSLSSDVSPLIRFVNRGDTTLADAYLHPLLSHYGEKLSGWFPGVPIKFMQSQGGLADLSDFRGRDAVLSGPAGGLVGAAKLTEAREISRIICLDMGGTSTDIATYEGTFDLTWERMISGVRLQQPMLTIETVAAGGGSIVRYHQGRLMVGPESAGADPGPACYGQGGPLTITDCNVYLGRIQEQFFPKSLGPEGNAGLSRSEIEESLQKLLNISQPESYGFDDPRILCEHFLKVAVETISRSVRKLTVHKGKDPADYVLCSYGGAGGQLVCDIAENLGVQEVFIHPLSGVLSALGIGMAPVSKVFEKSLQFDLRSVTDDALMSLKAEMISEARVWADHLNSEEPGFSGIFEMVLSYEGCDAKLILKIPETVQKPLDELTRVFHRVHREQFGYSDENGNIRVHSLNLMVELAGSVSAPTFRSARGPSEKLPDVTVFCDGSLQEVPVCWHGDLDPSKASDGPLLVLFNESTVWVRPGWTLNVDTDRSLRLTRRAESLETKDLSDSSVVSDPLNLELFHNYFMSVAEQMGEVLAKTARSVNIRERLDFSCALFDSEGSLISNAPHVPVHLGSMSESIRSLIRHTNGCFKPGDSWLMNCPFHGGTHLPDITVVTPVFSRDQPDKPFCFVASRGHHGDVGGIAPGSMPSMSRTCDEEGVLISWSLLTSNGMVKDDDIRRLLSSGQWPARNPDANLSDLKAQLAANHKGSREILELVSLRGIRTVKAYMEHIQENGESLIRALIPNLKKGQAELTSDQGFTLKVTIIPDSVHKTLSIDFHGTSGQGDHNFNAPYSICKAAVLYVLRCLVGEAMPLNDGCLRPVTITCPGGSLLNPVFPAAVVAGNVETSSLLVDLLFTALGVKSCSQGTMNNFSFGHAGYQYYETLCGGEGASERGDGCSAVHTHMTNSRLTDPEILEARFPVVLEEFSVRAGSGGTGAFRGGDGVLRRLRFREQMDVNILSGNRERAPQGLFGGGAGKPGRNLYRRQGAEKDQILKGVCQLRVGAGDRIQIETPGGGGFQKAPSGLAHGSDEGR